MKIKEQIKNIVFIGSKQSGLEIVKIVNKLIKKNNDTLKLSIITLDDSTDIRSNLYEFRIYAAENNIPITVANSRKEADEFIKAISPDICFVMGWYWLFSEKILNFVAHGFIGVHYSLLPKYRGFSPLIWSIINGDDIAGFSIFSMNKGMDNGDIWLQKEIPIGKDEYIGEIMERFEKEVVLSFTELLPKILNGTAKPYQQDHAKGTYTEKRTPKSGKIDWTKSSTEIYNFIRAQSDPYPGAYTFAEGQKLKINKASISEENFDGVAGQLISRNKNELFVICGDKKSIMIRDFVTNNEKFKSRSFDNSQGLILK